MKYSIILLVVTLTLASASAFPGRSPTPPNINYETKDGADTAQHQIDHGVQEGHFHKDPQQSKDNRKEAVGGMSTHDGKFNDEKPLASLEEGGAGAHGQSVDKHGQLVEAGKTSAARKEADRKGTNKVTFSVDGKPAGKGGRGGDGPASNTRSQSKVRRTIGDMIHEKTHLYARKAAAEAYAEAYAEALPAVEAMLFKRTAAPEFYYI